MIQTMTLKEKQIYLWDLVKDVTGYRPRYYTEAQWNDEAFLDERIAFFEAMI